MVSKAKVKYVRSLQLKKYRQKYEVFLCEGSKLVLEAINSKVSVLEVFGLQEWINTHQKILQKYKIDVTPVSRRGMDQLSGLTTAGEVMAIMRMPKPGNLDVKPGEWIVALDDMRDPGNLGTILRIADWFGVEKIVCSGESVDVFSPKVVQATMGSIFRVKVFYENLSDFIRQNKSASKVYAATMAGESIYDLKTEAGILLIGNESHGISEELLDMADKQITIPRLGSAESLNAAMATGIILSHLIRPASK